MKKFFALILALAMMLTIVSCSESSKTTKNSDSASTSKSAKSSESEGTVSSGSKDTEASQPADMSDPIVLGHICDLTGNEAAIGLLSSTAMKFAVDYFNSVGGVNGRGLEVVEMDAQDDSSVASNDAQAMVEQYNATVVFGPTQVGHKNSVSTYMKSAEVPAIFYNGTPVSSVSDNEYVVSIGGSTNQPPSVMADYVYNDLGYKTVITICTDTTGARTEIDPFIEGFEAQGGVVVDSLWVPAGEVDTSTYMLSASSQEADCIVIWMAGSQAINLWTQWFELGVYETKPMLSSFHGGCTDYFIWNALYYSGEEGAVNAALDMGVYAPCPYCYSVDNEMNEKLLEFYASYDWGSEAETYGSVPVGSNLFGSVFSAVQAVVEVMEQLDDPTDSKAIYEALQHLDTQTPEGTLIIDSSRIAIKDIFIVKVVQLDDGTFNYEVVKTYPSVPIEGYSK